MLDVYWLALHQPVPLIPDISLEFVRQSADDSIKDALANARKRFVPSRGFSRAAKRAYRIAYGRVLTQLPEGFTDAAIRVYAPLWRNITKGPALVAFDLRDGDDSPTRAVLEQADDE